MTAPVFHDQLTNRVWRLLGWCCIAGLLSGCAKSIYYAGDLPDEFRVPAASNVATVNLTRLASPGTGSSVIGEGDVLELSVTTGYESQGDRILVRVADDGTAHVPLIGPVQLAGLEPSEAEQSIAAMAIQRGVFRRPHVTVMVKRPQVNKVTVVGAVENPGVYELPRGSSDLLSALASAGGLTDEAGTSVEILRKPPRSRVENPAEQASFDGRSLGQPGLTSERVDLSELSQGKEQDLRIGDGDVLMVFPQERRVVHVMGLVKKPDQFEIPPNQDLYLLDALAQAGGRTLQVANKVQVIRRVPGQPEPIVIEVSVREAKRNGKSNLRLAPGDVVSVEETPLTVAVDAVRSFVRIGITGGIPLF